MLHDNINLTPDERARYARHLTLPSMGEEGQLRLRASHVVIIGAGGLGSPVALYLAAAGVGRITLADGDTVELTNLQRQVIHHTADCGRRKVDSAIEKMLAINPAGDYKSFGEFVTAENIAPLIAGADFIIDATDSFKAKFLINDACVAVGKPYCHGGIFQWEGQAMTYVPGHACYHCLFDSMPPAPTGSPSGPVGVLPGIIGCIQAAEAIKYLTGAGELLTDRLLRVDILSMTFTTVTIPLNPDCVAGHD